MQSDLEKSAPLFVELDHECQPWTHPSGATSGAFGTTSTAANSFLSALRLIALVAPREMNCIIISAASAIARMTPFRLPSIARLHASGAATAATPSVGPFVGDGQRRDRPQPRPGHDTFLSISAGLPSH